MYVTKIVYVYDRVFKDGVVENLLSTLDVGFFCPCKKVVWCSMRYI